MNSEPDYSELVEYLRKDGQSEADIAKIMARVRQYELETQHDSIMDAIGSGSFDLAALIQEVVGDRDQGGPSGAAQ